MKQNLNVMFKNVQRQIENEKKTQRKKLINRDPKVMHELFKKQSSGFKSIVGRGQDAMYKA